MGTATEVYDYLRLLYAKIGQVHCPRCGAPVRWHSAERVVDTLLAEHPGGRALVGFPLAVPPGTEPGQLWSDLTRRGFARVWLGGAVVDLSPPPTLGSEALRGGIIVVLDRIVLEPTHRKRIAESVEMALLEGGGRLWVDVDGAGRRVFSREFRCVGCDTAVERPQPLLFSFNHPVGACPECKGFGNILRYDEALVIPIHENTNITVARRTLEGLEFDLRGYPILYGTRRAARAAIAR